MVKHVSNSKSLIMKRISLIFFAVFLLLLIPGIAMQFSNEVNWSAFDFIIAGFLLTGLGLGLNAVFVKFKGRKRWLAGIALLIFFLLVWVEMAVGVFGSPIAGS